jgi:hypothetical protein
MNLTQTTSQEVKYFHRAALVRSWGHSNNQKEHLNPSKSIKNTVKISARRILSRGDPQNQQNASSDLALRCHGFLVRLLQLVDGLRLSNGTDLGCDGWLIHGFLMG